MSTHDKNGTTKPLNCDRDAARWASEFIERFRGRVVGDTVDDGLMIAWFANAMMCGEDTYRWKKEAEHASAVCASEIIERCAKVCEEKANKPADQTTEYTQFMLRQAAEAIRSIAISAMGRTMPNTIMLRDEVAKVLTADINEKLVKPVVEECRKRGMSDDEINLLLNQMMFDAFAGLHRFPPSYRPTSTTSTPK